MKRSLKEVHGLLINECECVVRDKRKEYSGVERFLNTQNSYSFDKFHNAELFFNDCVKEIIDSKTFKEFMDILNNLFDSTLFKVEINYVSKELDIVIHNSCRSNYIIRIMNMRCTNNNLSGCTCFKFDFTFFEKPITEKEIVDKLLYTVGWEIKGAEMRIEELQKEIDDYINVKRTNEMSKRNLTKILEKY